MSPPAQASATPLLLEKNETRLWRPERGEVDPGGFILKITPRANGFQHLVLSTREIAPGAAIPTNKHLEQDEIVLIEKGTIHAHVGDQERDLHAGGMVFIPQHTWVVKNTGTEPASIVAVFSSPDSRTICAANQFRLAKSRQQSHPPKRMNATA